MFTRAVDIDGPAGRLEAILMTPEGPPTANVVLCHAHPLHGGVMHFKVLYRAAKVFQAKHYAVLRFNFRGVGRSEGVHDEGRGEQDDLRAAIDWLTAEFPDRPLVAGGFSFGSVMAFRVGVSDPRVGALVALGFPVSVMKSTRFLQSTTKPRLFVQGEADPFGGGNAIRRLVDTLPEPRSLSILPGSDHFFTDRLDQLEAAISDWLELI